MSVSTIVLADDHHVVRQGLRTLLEAEPAFCVIGEAGDGLETVQQVKCLRPDVLVLDLMMPGLSGQEVTRQVSQCSPRTRVVILSMYTNEAYVLEALRAGAAAYVFKESTSVELVHAIHEAIAGRRYLSPPLSDRAIEVYVHKTKEAMQDPYEELTTREREVLHLAAEGITNAKIATRLSLSPRTIEGHRASLMHKLSMRTQTDLIRYALQRGIIELNVMRDA